MGRTSSIFHEFVIEGHRFSAIMAVDGPYLGMTAPDGQYDGVSLGISTVHYFRKVPGDTGIDADKTGWWLAKYGNQPRVDFNRMSEPARKEVMRQFGILFRDLEVHRDPNVTFRESPAFQGLREWVRKHPRVAKASLRSQPYIQWGSMVEDLMFPKGQAKSSSKSTSKRVLLGKQLRVWTITMTDLSGFPHVSVAQTRDIAIAEFMQQAYMFAQTQPGEYYVVGEDIDGALAGLHLLREFDEGKMVLCVVSMTQPETVIPQEGYQPVKWGKRKFAVISEFLEAAIQDNADPESAEAEELKDGFASLLWSRPLAKILLEERPAPSGKVFGAKQGEVVWQDMSEVRMWHLATAVLTAMPKPRRTNS